MADSEAKRIWMGAYTVQVAARLNRHTDKDILEYFGDRISASKVKEVLRDYMARHPKGEKET